MFYSDNVQDTRQLFFSSWNKYCTGQALTALEQQLVEVILAHPEYHSFLEQGEVGLSQAFFPELGETNPFLHMGLHLAIRDQVSLDRPTGINSIYQNLLNVHKDRLVVEHTMIERLAECLWVAQREGTMPDENYYLSLFEA